MIRQALRRLQEALIRHPARERPRGVSGKAEFAVLTITEDELHEAQALMNLTQLLPQCEAPYYAGAPTRGQYDVVLCRALERTNVPAYESVAELLFQFKPDFVLLVGTAGGVDEVRGDERIGRDGVALGDVIVPDFIEYSEFRKIVPGKNRSRNIPHDHPSLSLRRHAEAVAASGLWLQRLAGKNRLTAGNPKVVSGNVLACEKIWGDYQNAEQQALLDQFDKAVAIETESYGVARAIFNARESVHYNPQLLVIRGISDMVNSPSNEADRKQWTAYAACAASAFALGLIERVRAFATRRN